MVGEPFLGRDLLLFAAVLAAPGGELELRAVGGRAGLGRVGEPLAAGLVDLLEVRGSLVQRPGERGGFLRLPAEPVALGGILGGVGFGLAECGGRSVRVDGLPRAGQLFGDVLGGPGFLALVRTQAHAQLAVAELELVAVGLGSAEGAPGRAPRGIGLDLVRFRYGTDRRGGVVVAGQLAVRGYHGGTVHPLRSRGLVLGWLAERFARPLRDLREHLGAEVRAAAVGGVGEFAEVGGPLRVVDLGRPVAVAVADRVEGDRVADAAIDHGRQLARTVQRPVGDRVGEDLARVVPGEFRDDLDETIRQLFKKEWSDIESSARQAQSSGYVSRTPVDALDHLSVKHAYVLIEKFCNNLNPDINTNPEISRRIRAQISTWVRELIGIRNTVAHGPQESLTLRDALRYVDTAARALDILGAKEAEELRDIWSALVAKVGSTDVLEPPSTMDTLPSRELITTDFIGRKEQLADLWRWLGDDTRRIWALVGNGGKGKTTVAYEFANQCRSLVDDYNLQGVLWLSAKKRRFVEGETVPTPSADFSDLDSALNWILVSLGWDEDVAETTEIKLGRVVNSLREFPMLIVADDIDSLDEEQEQAVEFFAQFIPQTGSKTLLTSRRAIFGLGGCTTHVSGMTEPEVGDFLRRRGPNLGLAPDQIGLSTVRRVREVTDGSPLYIEDLLRLAHFYSLDHALHQWAGRKGDAAREYSLQREMEKLSKDASSALAVLAYADGAVSMQECADVLDLSYDQAENALGELRNWNLLAMPGLVEDIPRFTCSRNLSKLMRRTLEGSDEEQRILNGLKRLRGVVVGSSRVRKYIQQAVALQRRGDQEAAEVTLREGHRAVPNSDQLHSITGWLYSKWQPNPRIADAEEDFTRAETLGNRSRDLYAHWADMELKRSEYRKAIAVCDRARKAGVQEDQFIWRIAGMACTSWGRQLMQSLSTEEAREAFDRADHALRRAQELCREPGDLSRTLQARLQLASTDGRGRATAVLREWEGLLPDDPYRSTIYRRN